MPVTDRKLQFDDGSNTLEIDLPIFNYQTFINMPLEIVELDNKQFEIYDHGQNAETYDIRKCVCDFELNATDQNNLNEFFSNASATPSTRGKDCIIRMKEYSGFFPFGADKGDKGDFTVAAFLIQTPKLSDDPFNYFECSVVFINTGSYPAYSLIAEVNEGSFTIGSVTNNRFPPGWFEPKSVYANHPIIHRDGSSTWIDKSANGDGYTTDFTMYSNQSKTAKILQYLTSSNARANSFQVTQDAKMYMFGRDKTNTTSNVYLVQKEIICTHVNYNRFTFPLKFSFISAV